MTDDRPPAPQDWGELTSDLDVHWAFRQLNGKTIEEAAPHFTENPIEAASDLRFTPPVVFNYYIFAFASAALAESSQGEADLGSCFLRLVRDRAVEKPGSLAPIWSRLRPAVLAVAERQSFYDATPEIYGSFSLLREETEAAMREYDQRGA